MVYGAGPPNTLTIKIHAMMYIVKKEGSKPFATNDRRTAEQYAKAVGIGAEITEVLASVECTTDDMKYYAGYYDDTEDWNGFLCPWFTLEEGMKMVESREFEGLQYNEELGHFTSEDSDEAFEPQVKQTIDGSKILYPIGAYYWAWSKYEFKR